MSGWDRDDYQRRRAEYYDHKSRKPWETRSQQVARQQHNQRIVLGILWRIFPVIILFAISGFVLALPSLISNADVMFAVGIIGTILVIGAVLSIITLVRDYFAT